MAENKTIPPNGILSEMTQKENLLVTFGGIQQGFGVPIFEFMKTISEIDCDKIFIRDFNQSWYQMGVDPNISSINLLTEYLQRTITENKYKQVCFIGNSMGGYAAILFGTLLNINSVIAFSPQSFIDKVNRIIYRDSRWKKQIANTHTFQGRERAYFDLKKHLRLANYSTIINIYFSSIHRLDKIHAERLKKCKNIILNPMNEGGHAIVKIIRDQGNLKDLIRNGFNE